MPDISILIPVYKTEEWLPRCLDSVCGQTHGNIEIIVVNDGSPGNCGEIVAGYAERFPAVRYLEHESNKSLLQARMTTIRAATGEYLLFVDSDDWVDLDTCAAVLRAARHSGADIIHFPHSFDKGPGKAHYRPQQPVPGPLGQGAMRQQYFSNKIAGNIWGKLYKSSLFQPLCDSGLYDGVRCSLSEDFALTLPVFYLAETYQGVAEGRYWYATREGSSTSKDATETFERWVGLCGDLAASYAICREFLQRHKAARQLVFLEWLNRSSFIWLYERLRHCPPSEKDARAAVFFPLYDKSVIAPLVAREDQRFLSLAQKRL